MNTYTCQLDGADGLGVPYERDSESARQAAHDFACDHWDEFGRPEAFDVLVTSADGTKQSFTVDVDIDITFDLFENE